MRQPLMSGFCGNPSRDNPTRSHNYCRGGNYSNPTKEFQPCPCPCHFPKERYECECGGLLAEAPGWPQEDKSDPDAPVYTHIDIRTGRATGEECP